jgi:UDP-N-acetylmuramate--alanine ligase
VIDVAVPAALAGEESLPLPERSELPGAGSRVHLVGIGGAGMRGLAVLLADEGYQVSGCDRGDISVLTELSAAGIELHPSHDPSHVTGVDLLICSSAVPTDAPELVAAREAGTPVMKRARALGALLNGRRLVGIAGTHGKTTITAMAGLACERAGLDACVAVGGYVQNWNGFARPGRGSVAIVEADEYDRSFLDLDPTLAVVSSMEPEHLDCYGSYEAMRAAYSRFVTRATGREGLIYCADDQGARELGQSVGSRLSYGLSADARYRVEILSDSSAIQRCRLPTPDGELEFRLGAPGEHNAQNAAAALLVALQVGAEPRALADSLVDFAGAGRRLQLLVDDDGIGVVDDYAHHPTEVRASIRAIRSRYPDRRVIVVFQPHLYTRTEAFAREFAAALSEPDETLLLPIYPAREAPIPGVTSELISGLANGQTRLATRAEALDVVRQAKGGRPTVIVFMGAGDVTDLAARSAADVMDREVGA